MLIFFLLENINFITLFSSVMTKINNLKRQAYKSRTSLKRKFENVSSKAEKRRRLENEDESNFLHSLLKDTMFSNAKKCVLCLSNINSATEINEDHELFMGGTLDLENVRMHRRFGKLWICKFCSEKNNSDRMEADKSSIFQLNTSRVDDETVICPKLLPVEDRLEEENSQEEQPQAIAAVMNPASKICFPVSSESLELFPNDLQLKSQSGFQIQKLLHNGNDLNIDTLSLLYEHQLNKYKKSKARQDLFVGKIISEETRTLNSVKACSSDKKLSGSSAWSSKQDSDVMWKMYQVGSFALYVEVNLPFNPSAMASVLTQEGNVISVEMIGEASQEFKRVYQVHRNHGADTECTVNCEKICLDDFLQENNVSMALTNRNVSTYAAVCDMFMKSYISNIIKSPASSLFSEDYHFQTVFKDDGTLKVVGVTWPDKMKKMNQILVDKSLGETDQESIQRDYLELVGNNISTTSEVAVLKEKFHMSEAEAQEFATLVAKHQIHFCRSCPKCEDPELPSLELSLTVSSDTPGNIVTSKKLRHFFIRKLKNLSLEDLQTLKTLEWVEELSELVERSDINEDNVWILQIEDEEFELSLDEVLTGLIRKNQDCPLAAAYQYCIMCVPSPDLRKVILKRRKLIESFTEPYNPFFLKAANSPISVKTVRGGRDFQNFKFRGTTPFSHVSTDLLHHSCISPTEVVCLADEVIKNVKTSSSIEYVYTGPDVMSLFKKVDKKTDKSFSVDGLANIFLEPLESKVTKYFKRLNGLDLLLSEFVVFYDFLGDEKSESQYEVYKEKLDKIEDSLATSVMGKEALPELIVIDNGNVFQKRSKAKFLQYPEFDDDSFEYRYSQVLLFGHNLNYEELSKEFVDQKFAENDQDGEKILKKNKLKFLLKMRGGSS